MRTNVEKRLDRIQKLKTLLREIKPMRRAGDAVLKRRLLGELLMLQQADTAVSPNRPPEDRSALNDDDDAPPKINQPKPSSSGR
jgi:hypothetical protein